MPGVDLNFLMRQAKEITSKVEKRKTELANETVEGKAGDGLVIATANGVQELKGLKIDKKAIDPNDTAMLEDLIIAAVNAALTQSRDHMQKELGKISGGIKLPRPDVTPDALNRLVAQLSKLPGIGEKTAQRLAFHVMRSPPEYARGLAQALTEVVDKVRLCPRCFSLTDGPPDSPCTFCTDQRRDDKLLCVVEGIADELAIERTREYRGRYHVLHGVLSPLEGVGPDQLRIRELLVRLESAAVEEVIVATNPDVEGEATALYLVRLLRPMGIKVTRLAQGIPMGGDLEYADQATLARALAARRDL